MRMKSAGKVIHKYYIVTGAIAFVYLLIVIPCIWFLHNLWSLLLCTLLLFPLRISVMIATNRVIGSVLTNELDAQKFVEIINYKHFAAPLSYRINAALASGNYQSVINMVDGMIHSNKCTAREKWFCLSIAARVYFEVRDDENLRLQVEEAEKLKDQYPRKQFLHASDSIFCYYRAFLEGDYRKCEEIINKRTAKEDLRKLNGRYVKLFNDFCLAVLSYEKGETAEAKVTFESIVVYAPKMNTATVSQKYLDAIKNKEEPVFFETSILPDNSYQPDAAGIEKKIRIFRLLYCICLAILVVSLVAPLVFEFIDKKSEPHFSGYEIKLNDAVKRQYDEADFVTYFDVYKENAVIDSFCLVANSNGLGLARVLTEEEQLSIFPITNELKFDSYYAIADRSDSNYLYFKISQKKPSEEPLYCLVEFKWQNKTCWAFVDDIKPLSTD